MMNGAAVQRSGELRSRYFSQWPTRRDEQDTRTCALHFRWSEFVLGLSLICPAERVLNVVMLEAFWSVLRIVVGSGFCCGACARVRTIL